MRKAQTPPGTDPPQSPAPAEWGARRAAQIPARAAAATAGLPPLPWHQPKSTEDDPLAHERVQAIMRGPGYRLADEDVDFLARADLRGVRLQLDYTKAQFQLEQHGVAHTIVVFGSTRIPEPAAAIRALRQLRAQAEQERRDRLEMGQQRYREIAIAERILAKSHYYDVARDLGRLICDSSRAACGADPSARMVVMTGGGPGIMEAANRGAFDADDESVGLNIALPHEQYPNPYVTPDLCLRFHYFALRKLHFVMRARALVAFPGGYGTFDELFETLTLIQTRKIDPVPVILVGKSYWQRAFDVNFLVDEGVIAAEDRDLFSYAESAAAVWESILEWYRSRDRPLLPRPAPGVSVPAASGPPGPA
jgi:uncharacterized protein (TIGR00730 family)